MTIREQLLSDMIVGIRLGLLDRRGWTIHRSVADRWRVETPDHTFRVAWENESAYPGGLELIIWRHDEPGRIQDEPGGIIVDPSEPILSSIAARYFGELAGRLVSGWDAMDRYYPAGPAVERPGYRPGEVVGWYPSPVWTRFDTIGGDR